MTRTHRTRSYGFTLIELLVVIAIIGLLASVVLASLNTARDKAKDAQRLSNLHSLRTALELYYSDNGRYPDGCNGSNWSGISSSYGSCTTTGANGYIVNLAPDYIPQLPDDPDRSGSKVGYVYRVFNGGEDYGLLNYQTVSQTVTSESPYYRYCTPTDSNTPHTYAIWGVTCH